MEPKRVYPYAIVEKALMDAFDVGKDGHLAFRARLRNLQRLGLAPATPGSGKRMQYSRSDIYDLAFALNLAEFGLDPKKIVDLVTPGEIAKQHKDDLFCVFTPETFSRGTRPKLDFVNAISVATRSVYGRRVAVINIKEMKFLVDAHLWEGPK